MPVRAYGRRVSEFLVEAYLSRTASAATPRVEDVSAAADQLSLEGKAVRLLRAIFVPEDETCFYLFRSGSPDAVREAADRAGLQFERITAAMSCARTHTKGGRPPQPNIQEARQ